MQAHGHESPPDDIGQLNSEPEAAGRDPHREIARLEQKTLALERELQAHRLAEVALQNALRERDALTPNATLDEEAFRLRAAAIVESSEDAIISKDLNGDITSWNEGAERLYGYTASEMIGRSIAVLIPEDHTNDFPTILARLGRGERIDHYETVRVAKDGRRIDVSLTISPIKDRLGHIIGASKIARDITEKKRIAEALRASEERLAHELRRKDEFIAILAHELRNPLAPVRNASHYLSIHEMEAPDVQRAVQIIDKHVSVMSRLIDDLVDVARISRGALELRPERAVVQELVEAAVDASRHEIDSRRHHLRLALPKELITLHADRTRLIQVLCNLITNAAKYSPQGGAIEISARVDEGRMLSLSVRDRGAGIPREKLNEIFDLFAQLHRTLDQQSGGLGIGLTLARQIVELHGGSIEAHSEGVGLGSEFIVRMPILPAPPVVAAELAAPVRNATRRMLVADDNRDAADSLAMLLVGRGHEVVVAYDGRSALELADRHRPEVLLLDIGMPEMDGYEVARRIRDRTWGKDVMLVALTGWGQEKDERQAFEAGFDAHVVKPAQKAILNRLLAGLPASETSTRH